MNKGCPPSEVRGEVEGEIEVEVEQSDEEGRFEVVFSRARFRWSSRDLFGRRLFAGRLIVVSESFSALADGKVRDSVALDDNRQSSAEFALIGGLPFGSMTRTEGDWKGEPWIGWDRYVGERIGS